MAANPQITGFDANSVRAGLRLAMSVGLPVEASDQPAFYMPITGAYVPVSPSPSPSPLPVLVAATYGGLAYGAAPYGGGSMLEVTVAPSGAVDAQGVPFNAGMQVQRPARTVVTGVPCAIEYQDQTGVFGPLGLTSPSRVVLTLLDQDYAQVKGFEFCVIGGIRYDYLRTETPKALVTVGLYRVHCAAEDQG